MAKEAAMTQAVPLWQVMDDPQALKSLVVRLAREFGYGLVGTEGSRFTTPMVTVHLRVSSMFDAPDKKE